MSVNSPAKDRPRTANRSVSSNQTLIIVGIIVAAVVALIILIALSGQSGAVDIDYAALPQSRGEDGAFILGAPDAPVTIIEFADFACPHCQTYHPDITRFISEYVATGQAGFEYRTFPTAGGDLTIYAARVQECANEQRPGTFWAAYKLFYELGGTNQYTEDMGRVLAEREGLSYSDLLTCVTRLSEGQSQVNADITFGRNNNVNGTPAVMARVGDGPAQFITFNGVTYDRGPVPFDVLSGFVRQINGQS